MRDIYLFITCLVLITGLSIGGYIYHTETIKLLTNNFNTQLNSVNYKLENLKQESEKKFSIQNQKLISNEKKINLVEEKLDVKSQQLLQELESTTYQLKRNIENVQEANEQQIEELSSQIKKVELSSITGLSDLQSQLKNLGVSKDFANTIQKVLPAVVSVMRVNNVIGSGAIYKSEGYIVTNRHVVEGEDDVIIGTFDRKKYRGSVIGSSSTRDIAVVKINSDKNDFPYLTFANSANARIGEKVIALGSPGGLEFTVTEGIISALNRIINGVNHLQTDVPINPGNSGGPLVNWEGKIIGINRMKIEGFEGVGFAISSNEVQKAISEINS